MQRVPPIYPVLLVVAWLMEFFIGTSAPLFTLWRPLVLLVVASATVYAIALVVIRKADWAALSSAVALCAVLAFKFGLMVLGLVTLWLLALYVRRRLSKNRALPTVNLPAISRALDVFAAALLAVVVVNGGLTGAYELFGAGQPAPTHASTNALPDIYVVLLDGYPGLTTTTQEFGLDQSAFVSGLDDLGFDVPAGSRSNYMQTWTTLASMLWMRYLADIPDVHTGSRSYFTQVRELTRAINEAPVLNMLRTYGYRTISSPSAREDTGIRAVDQVIDDGSFNELEEAFIRATPLGYLGGAPLRGLADHEAQRGIDDAFAHLEEVVNQDAGHGPIFFFDHVMAPHPPFVFSSTGSGVELPSCWPLQCTIWEPHYDALGMTRAQYGEALGSELAYLNGRILDSAKLISEKDPGAIVVFFSDHGTRYDVTNEDEFFQNFFAARTPGKPALFGANPTPVNFFPDLFNAITGSQIPTQTTYEGWMARSTPLDLQLHE